jgi:Uncharacterized conserved protein
MTTIKTKRAYDPAEPSDGYRVLVDRLWPRGVSKEELKLDLWAKDISPSNELRHWFHENPDGNWTKFEDKYREELEKSPYVDDFINQIKDHKVVTLIYSSKNEDENNALVLKEYIERKMAH